MKYKIKKFLLLSILMVVSSCQIVFAETSVDSVADVVKNSGVVQQICHLANTVSGRHIMSYDASNGSLTFSNAEYSKLDSDEKHTFMGKVLSCVKSSSLGPQQKNKVYNFIVSQDSATTAAMKYLKSDTSADFVSAQGWFRPFSSPISTVMGFLCIVIFVFLALSMVFDIAYLILPGFQLLVEHGEPNKKPFGVSNEAWKTNREIANANNTENVMSVYMKKRVPVILLIAICLGYLISGKIYDLVVYFIDAFSVM